MLGVQVAVALADASTVLAGAEERLVAAEEARAEVAEDLVVLGGEQATGEGRGGLEVFGPPAAERIGAGVGRDLGARRRARVEAGQHGGELVDRLRGALPEAVHEERAGGQTPHPHDVIERLARGPECRAAASPSHHRQDVEIDAGRQAAVQPDLLQAEMAPELRRAEVEERKTHGLFQLVHVRAGQEHVRDVRLNVLDRARPVRVEVRRRERSDDFVLAHGSGIARHGRGGRPMLKEFREFALKGNAVDLAIGVIIGAAFGTVVTSMVNDILMPPIGKVLGGVDFANFFVVLGGGQYPSLKAAKDAGAATINYGVFVNNVINLLIVAAVLFLVVKAMNALRREQAVAPVKAPTTKDCPMCATTIPLTAKRCPHCTSTL